MWRGTSPLSSCLVAADTSLTPYRGHAGLVVPPVTYAGDKALKNTYGIENGPYLIQTPNAGLVLGPFNATVLSSIGTAKDLFYIDDDSVVVPKFKDCELGLRRPFCFWSSFQTSMVS